MLVAPATSLALLVPCGLVDEGLPIERATVARLFVAGADLRDLVGARPVGDVYSWFGSGDAAVRRNLLRLARGVVRCPPFTPPHDHRGHVARHFLSTAGVSATVTLAQTRVPVSPADAAIAAEFWCARGLAGHCVLALHRGAGRAAKRWVDEGYRHVALWWRRRHGKILEIAGPADSYAALEQADAVARDRPLSEVAALLARADVVLGADSGVLHLAGAVGLRGVGLFGPTDPRRWRPLGGRIVCLTSRMPSVGQSRIPLEGISAERTVRALRCVTPDLPAVDDGCGRE